MLTPPKLKGLARAIRATPYRERHTRVLGREAEERLFEVADVMSEGSVRETEGTYFGSTMIAFDLERLEGVWRGSLDAEGRRALAEAVDGSVRVRLRVMRLACEEVARRLPDRILGTAQVETHVQLRGGQLHVDVDLEVPIGVSSARRHGGR